MTLGTPDILAHLNERQRDAVTTLKGPVLILAGAGSGKTKALTHRIANLMHHGVAPWQILAVTFTNRAAKEMKERIKKLLTITGETDIAGEIGQGRMPTMGTFHSICARILRRDVQHLGRDRNFVIYDGDDQEKLMKEVLKKLRIDEKELKAKAALGYVGRFKCEAVSAIEAMREASTERMMLAVKAYREYQDELLRANAMDFDDLILETVRLFHEKPEVLERYQETWQFLHVDEYQDTNHAQYLFITLLARKYRNLCVIGDPDQSIYAFRGADIRNILEFQQEYSDALSITLDQNYRSTQLVLTAANAVIDVNPNRPQKQMWSERKTGPLITLHEVRDERKEAEEVVRAIQAERAAGMRLNDQVVLYRTNAQSRLFEEACLRGGLPYRLVGGVKFYARREVKDVLAYLHVILNPSDTVSLLRIINVPARKIGATSLEHIQAFAGREQVTLWQALLRIDEVVELNSGVRDRIYKFTDLIQRKQVQSGAVTAAELTAGLLSEIDFEQWLRDDTDEGEDRWNNVQELFTVMRKYDGLEPHASLVSFLEEVALVSEVDKLATAEDDAVTLMTLHLCKGLEFEHVLLAGCEEGLFPHSNSQFDKEQLEEERRLMYVGMTRAKTKLHILYARSRTQWGNEQANAPSRFLDDLPETVVERRSDELLSAFAWAGERGQQQVRRSGPLQPFRQHGASSEFNQDVNFDDASQEQQEFFEGARVAHPAFGAGTITSRRGDLVSIAFDNGQKKTFALNIAPLKLL